MSNVHILYLVPTAKGTTYVDTAVVNGVSQLSSTDTASQNAVATLTSHGIIFSLEEFIAVPDGTTLVSTAIISAIDTYDFAGDGDVITSIAFSLSTDTVDHVETKNVLATTVIISDDVYRTIAGSNYVDQDTSTSAASMSSSEVHTIADDAAIVTGAAVISASEIITYVGEVSSAAAAALLVTVEITVFSDPAPNDLSITLSQGAPSSIDSVEWNPEEAIIVSFASPSALDEIGHAEVVGIVTGTMGWISETSLTLETSVDLFPWDTLFSEIQTGENIFTDDLLLLDPDADLYTGSEALAIETAQGLSPYNEPLLPGSSLFPGTGDLLWTPTDYASFIDISTAVLNATNVISSTDIYPYFDAATVIANNGTSDAGVTALESFYPAILANTFEGGSNGVTITTGNSGGSSGNAFDLTTGASPIFSNLQAMHGTLSAALQTIGTVQWTTSLPLNQTTMWGRAYVLITQAPNVNTVLVNWFTPTSNGTASGFVRLATSSKVVISAKGGATQTSTTVLSSNTWYRLEFKHVIVPSGTCTTNCIIYVGDSTSATETMTQATGTGVSTDTSMSSVRWGSANSVNANTVFLDDIQINILGFPGHS